MTLETSKHTPTHPDQKMSVFKVKKEIAVCGGRLLQLTHNSNSTGTSMDVNVYLPKQYYMKEQNKIPTIYYLSGLTCTPQNASEKAFWQPEADRYGFAMVFPDTSPRGDNVADDPEGGWDFGQGAGFYVNATQEPFRKNYQMFDYVHNELPRALADHFGPNRLDFLENISITGHSMGGLGALVGFLSHYKTGKYKACSAFAPIMNPIKVPWGKKAFNGFLGQHENSNWDRYDPVALIQSLTPKEGEEILIHVGSNDPFLTENLRPDLLQDAIKDTPWSEKFSIRLVEGFDHSYYFVSTFVPEHAAFHAKHLGLK